MPLRTLAPESATGSASSVPYMARFWNVTVAHAAAKGLIRNSEGGNAASGWRDSNRASMTAAGTIAKPIATITGSSAWPSETRTHAAASRRTPRPTAPARSKRAVTRGARAGSTRHAVTNAVAQTGTFTRKMKRQSMAARSPPTSGPTVAPTPDAALTMPNSAPRRPGGRASRSSPRPFGTSAAAAIA